MKYIRDTENINALGKRIIQLRLSQKVSLIQLSFETGISREQLGRIEKGLINTSVSNIFIIAKALEIKVRDLFDY